MHMHLPIENSLLAMICTSKQISLNAIREYKKILFDASKCDVVRS